MTPAERRLWTFLRTPRFKPFHIRRQAPIGYWFADFLSHRARLLIEIDGDTHDPQTDDRRDAGLARLGYETLRFWNSDVWRNASGVADVVFEELSARYSPHPDPPQGGGGDDR